MALSKCYEIHVGNIIYTIEDSRCRSTSSAE